MNTSWSPPSHKPLLQLHLLTTTLPMLHQICTVDGQTVCYITSKNVCSRMKHLGIFCNTADKKKNKPYIPQPSGQPPCPAAHELSRYHQGCSEVPPQLPSLHSDDREMPHHKRNLSNKQQQSWKNVPLTFSSNSEIFCFNSATYCECSASRILAIMRFSFI